MKQRFIQCTNLMSGIQEIGSRGGELADPIVFRRRRDTARRVCTAGQERAADAAFRTLPRRRTDAGRSTFSVRLGRENDRAERRVGDVDGAALSGGRVRHDRSACPVAFKLTYPTEGDAINLRGSGSKDVAGAPAHGEALPSLA